MAKQTINVGTTANDKKGDSLRAAFQKVNANFTELYTALGLAADANLNLGAFEFAGSVLSTTDSSSITIAQAVNITSNLTMSGDIVPAADNAYDLGSPTHQWRSLYLTGNTVYFDGVPLSVTDDGTLIINGSVAATPGGSATWDSVTNKPTFADVATTGSYDDLTDTPTIPSITGLATETYVNDAVGAIVIPDVSNFITAEDLPEPVDLTGYALTSAIPDVSNFITAEDIPAIPEDISDLTDTTNLLGQGGADTGNILFDGNDISNSADNEISITTEKTITTNNSYTNTTNFSTDVDPGIGSTLAGWYQRNSEQIEFSLFGPAEFRSYLTGLALGRTVIVTYSTAGGNQTLTRTLTQQFANISEQEDPNNSGWTRVSGRIDATLPENQTGIVSINFPVYSLQYNSWEFDSNGDLTLPVGGDIVDSNGDSVLGGAAGPVQPYLELTDTPFITQPVTLGTPVTAIADLRGQDALVEVVIGEGPVIESITVTTPGVLYVVGQRYRINYWQVGGNSDDGNIDFEVATVGAGGALLTIANAAFAGPAQVNTGTYSNTSIEYRPTEFDIVGTGLTLTRGLYGGLFNSEEEYSYNSSVSPIGTLWNADGWGTLVGFNTRTYERFDLILTGPDNTPPGELIMWDTINDKYYKFAINIWGTDNNEFSYTRTLITDPNYFKKDDYATVNNVDVIEDDSTLQIGITRGLNGGIYNPFTEEDWNQNVSPDGTLWNVDGWNDLTDVETRTYTNFYAAYDQQLGNLVPRSQAVMYVPSIDKYYAIEWLGWTQGIGGNTQGGGFSYTRREIDLTKLTQGITFADGTVQTTAYTGTNVVSTAVGDRRIETASGYKEVSVTQRVTNNYTGAVSQTTNGYELRIARTPELDAVIIPLNENNTDETYALSFDNVTFREVWLSSIQETEYWFYYQVDNNQTTPQTENDPVYLRITTGGDSVVWWNKTELPGGAGDFRGAVIDYHAYTGSGTIIGTIHIVDDDGEEYITHTEVSSGSNSSMNDNLWIVTSEGQIRYARLDGVARTLKIHWTAKVFYGSELYD